jgi:hypothetical protein
MSETLSNITDQQTVPGEIVLSERVTTNEFMITEIYENIRDRFVRADIELGPFVVEDRGGQNYTRGTSRRGITVWENEAYDAVRDTWRNEDLIAVVKAALSPPV